MEKESVSQHDIERNRRLLGISNTYMSKRPWLSHMEGPIQEILSGVRELVVIPYALADMDAYVEKLGAAFVKLGFPTVLSPHQFHGDEVKLLQNAEAAYIGGGNTGRLNANLHALKNANGSIVDRRERACRDSLIDVLRVRVASGMPLLGASAGLNVMCVDIRTTNDMHIAAQRLPDGSLISRLDSLGVLPRRLNVNPHFLEKVEVTDEERARVVAVNDGLAQLIDHQGESRTTRLKEAIEMDPERIILALREGACIVVNGKKMELRGESGGLLFEHQKEPTPISPDSDISNVLERSS